MSSLKYFKSDYYILKRPHLILSSAGSNPYENRKALIQAKLLSCTYICEEQSRHWSQSNPNGYCTAPTYLGSHIAVRGDIHHCLAVCPSLMSTRTRMLEYMYSYSQQFYEITDLILTYGVPSHPKFVQFLLDCSPLPDVIVFSQQYGKHIVDILFKITRTYCASMHEARLSLQQ